MATAATAGSVVLFSGYYNTGYLADTWMWNGTVWTQQVPATAPPGRNYSAMASDGTTGDVVVFGGTNSSLLQSGDTWTSNGVT